MCISGRKITFEVVSMQMLARSFNFLVESESSLSDQLKVSLQLSHAFQSCPKTPRVNTSFSQVSKVYEVCAGGWGGLRGGTCVVEHPCAAALRELEPCFLGYNFSEQVKVLRDHQAANLNYGGGSW